MATLFSDIVDFRAKNITCNKEGTVMIKHSILKKNITILDSDILNNKKFKI